MKKISLLAGPALLLVLFVSGCETDDISARIQQKSTAYATLQPWEKSYIGKGNLAVGFTPDMVYMAVGNASTVTRDETSGNAHTELWTFRNFYLPRDAAHSRYAPYNPYAPNQPVKTIAAPFTLQSDYDGEDHVMSGGPTSVPVGMGRQTQSIAVTGGVQGGSGEPDDLQSYTLYILFVEGKIAKFGVKPS